MCFFHNQRKCLFAFSLIFHILRMGNNLLSVVLMITLNYLEIMNDYISVRKYEIYRECQEKKNISTLLITA